jgi:DNA-binding response OmpR family regulator
VIAESATDDDALEAADRAQPTLVLLDIGLPISTASMSLRC